MDATPSPSTLGSDLPGKDARPTGTRARSPWLALVTLLPLVWLLSVTFTAGIQKIAHPDPRIGFIAAGDAFQKTREQLRASQSTLAPDQIEKNNQEIRKLSKQALNMRINTVVTSAFLLMATAIILLSVREWLLLIARKKLADLHETEPVWLPEYAVVEGQPLKIWSLLSLGFLLLKEVSGQSAYDRATAQCACAPKVQVSLTGDSNVVCRETDGERFARVAEERFSGPNRCC